MTNATDRRNARRLDRVAVYGEVVEAVNDRRLGGRRTSDKLQALTGQPGLRPGRRAADRMVVAPSRKVVSW
jgi:hypothetical protein